MKWKLIILLGLNNKFKFVLLVLIMLIKKQLIHKITFI